MILAVLPPTQRSHPISIAFIGSGPLPLTSFFFADSLPSAHIHNIDNDVTAIAISSVLAKQCAYHSRMTFSTNDATSCGSLQRFDVVCIAALVGMDMDAKKEVLKAVSARMRNDALICVRSAVALRGLLYPVHLFSQALSQEFH
jgi:nicotianamine synthase